MLIPKLDIETAVARIRPHLPVTPLVRAEHFSRTLGARKTEATQFEIVSNHVSDLVTVSDKSAMRALVDILETEKLLTEPASSCSVAALIEGRIRVTAAENVVVVLCGANIRLDALSAVER